MQLKTSEPVGYWKFQLLTMNVQLNAYLKHCPVFWDMEDW
jgi:hypothetical protein